ADRAPLGGLAPAAGGDVLDAGDGVEAGGPTRAEVDGDGGGRRAVVEGIGAEAQVGVDFFDAGDCAIFDRGERAVEDNVEDVVGDGAGDGQGVGAGIARDGVGRVAGGVVDR